MPALDVFNRNLRALEAFNHMVSACHTITAEALREKAKANYTMIAINDALAALMRQGYVEISRDGYKRVGTVAAYRREHDPSNNSNRNAI